MSNHSIIEHRANYHFIKMEEDYIAICSNGEKPPHCKALVLAVLEHWMNTKRDKGEKEWIYLSMPQWIKYTYMIYERNVITDSLSELMAEGFVEREPIIMYSQKTFVYRLNIKNIQKAIRALPEKSDQEIMPNLDAYVAYKERAKKRAQARREEKEEGVGEKSRTSKKPSKRVREKSPRVGDKSLTVREKSPKVREKSTQLIYTKIPSNSTERERAPETSQEKPRTPEQPASSSHTLESTSSHSQSDTQTPPSEGEKTTQAPLLARPEKPEMPPDVMRWSAEKLVQVTEAKLGKYYSDQSRPDQIKAAQKILQKKITEEQYIAAYDDRNDDWWHQKKGLLHVVHMAARTDRGQMRIVEILDKLDDTPALKQATQTAAVLAEAGVKSGMRLENGKLVIDSNKTVSGLNYFNIPSKPTEQRGA